MNGGRWAFLLSAAMYLWAFGMYAAGIAHQGYVGLRDACVLALFAGFVVFALDAAAREP